jgi:DNA-binding response OmpR family regulator
MTFKLLVVDDEATSRKSLSQILELEGYEVENASNGEMALQKMRAARYDLAIMDIKMPGMDGIDVLRTAAEEKIDIQFILLTAYGSVETAIEAVRKHVHDYILKPARPEQIIMSVKSALESPPPVVYSSIREGQLARDSIQQDPEPILTLYGGITIDTKRRMAKKGDLIVNFTPIENRLLQVMIERAGRVIPHRDLVLLTQGYEVKDWEAPQVVRPMISRLRAKLAVLPELADAIINVRGEGYLLEIKILR